MTLAGPDLPEPPHHPGRTRRWTETVLSIAALTVSVSSIGIALEHGRIMEKLVVANSYPYLEGGRSNATLNGDRRLAVDLMNRGVGPANEKSLRLLLDGHYIRSLDDLFVRVFGEQGARDARRKLSPDANVVQTRFISPGADQPVFWIQRTDDNAALWDQLDQAMRNLTVEYCYCSVFDECWTVRGEDRTRVKACVRDPQREFTP